MPRRPSALIPCIGAVLVIATGCSKNPEAARRELIRSGDTYASSGKYAEAMVQYRGAVQKDGRSGEARLKLAETYMKLGDGQKAFNEYVRAADLLPSDVQTQLKAASMLLAAQQFVDAQHRADQALSLYPRNIEALLLRASALAGLQRTDEALGEAQKAIGADPARGEGYTTVGVIRLLRGEKAQAEQAFQKAIDISPRSVPARIALANFYWASGDRDRSIEQLKKILEIEPRNVQVNRTLAGIAIGTGHEGDAEGYLKASAVDDQGQLTLADFYARTARDNEARTILEKLAVPGGSAYAAATIGLATLVQRHGDQAAAGRILDNALAHAANDPDLLVAKSNWFAATGKLGEGLSLAQRAAQIAPGSASAQYTLGMLRQQHGEQTEAIKAYTEALRLNPSLVAAQVQLAQLHLRAGHLDDALQFALTAVKAAPAAADASLTLSRVYLARHDVANAEPLLKRLTQATANAPAVLAAVGEMERQKKNAPAAREALERAYAANHDY
jgi:tetratricopeptide (TPR) repeat protein